MNLSKVDIWMPVYIGDHLSETIGFTLSEHGAYLLSLMHYWKKGGALTPQELQAAAGREHYKVSQLFVKADGMWHHERLDRELKKAYERSEVARLKALKGVAARQKPEEKR